MSDRLARDPILRLVHPTPCSRFGRRGRRRIFTSRHRGSAPGLGWTLAGVFALAISIGCAVERGPGAGLLLLFGLPALLFGALIGRWWAISAPVVLTTAAVALGVDCSGSEQPQALMLAGSFAGVACRRLTARLTRR